MFAMMTVSPEVGVDIIITIISVNFRPGPHIYIYIYNKKYVNKSGCVCTCDG